MIVVGCGKQKLDCRQAQAKDLYTGSLFRAARRYAEASKRPWVILSGAHGVIAPELWVRSYDAGPPERGEALRIWAVTAALELEKRLATEGALRDAFVRTGHFPRVEVLAGERYARPLCAELDRLGVAWEQPLVGLGTGYRLSKLKRMAESLQSPAAREG